MIIGVLIEVMLELAKLYIFNVVVLELKRAALILCYDDSTFTNEPDASDKMTSELTRDCEFSF